MVPETLRSKEGIMTLKKPEFLRWVTQLLQGAGLSSAQASTAAEVFWRATSRKVTHHDISYLPQRLDWLITGKVNRLWNPKSIHETPSAEIWDVDGALGEVSCSFALERAMKLASQTGLGYAAVRHSNHFLASWPYVEWGAERGFFTIVWSNTDAGMSFPGGNSRVLGNNPLGFGFPRENGYFLGADLCLAYSSLGNLKELIDDQQSIPSHWGNSSQGIPAQTPKELWNGGIHPIGESKGLSLALLGELITGLLAGGETLDAVKAPAGWNTHNQMVLAWDLSLLGGLSAAQARGQQFHERLKTLGLNRIPGDRSQEASHLASVTGVEISSELEAQLKDWAKKLKVSLTDKS